MTKKLTREQWIEKYNSVFLKEIDQFRLGTNIILFGNATITNEIKHELNAIRESPYCVKMKIEKLEEDYRYRQSFTLTEYNGVELFITEYFKGECSIGVCDGRRVVFGHVIKKDDERLPHIINRYFDLFKAQVQARDAIDNLKKIAGNRNI